MIKEFFKNRTFEPGIDTFIYNMKRIKLAYKLGDRQARMRINMHCIDPEVKKELPEGEEAYILKMAKRSNRISRFRWNLDFLESLSFETGYALRDFYSDRGALLDKPLPI